MDQLDPSKDRKQASNHSGGSERGLSLCHELQKRHAVNNLHTMLLNGTASRLTGWQTRISAGGGGCISKLIVLAMWIRQEITQGQDRDSVP
jgi:hypothetical protein